MKTLQENMAIFQQQLQEGSIQTAYQALIATMLRLKKHFADHYPAIAVPGTMYYGYLDMTYFSLLPKALQQRDLKIALVFVYDAFRFEVWLSGKNKQVLTHYWNLFKTRDCQPYTLVKPEKGIDYILTHVLVEDPDFSDEAALAKQIETGTLTFIQDVHKLLETDASRS